MVGGNFAPNFKVITPKLRKKPDVWFSCLVIRSEELRRVRVFFFSFFYSVVFFSLTFLLKSRSDSCWSNDCLVDDCPSFSMVQRFYTVIFWFWVVFPVNNAQLGRRRRRAEGTDVLRKARWVAQASNEQQNSFLKDFTFQWIDTLF